MKASRFFRLVVAGISLSVGAAQVAHAENYTIGASLLTQQHPFYILLANAMKQQAQKDNVKLQVSISNQDLNKQISDVEDFITKRVNAIILSPVDSKGVKAALLKAQKAGIPRHAFLQFMNRSVMGSVFTQYKTPALVNLDWSTTFTPELLLKDLQLGLEAGRGLDVPMPVTAATREVAQVHLGAAQLQPDPVAYLQKDFAALFETMALGAGIKLESESIEVPSGLEA